MNFFNKPSTPLPNRSIEEIKSICKILFIDDKKFPMVENLQKNEGWANTRLIKDVDSLDQQEIKDAHILFVDVQGIGKKMQFKDEGLGLIVAIKERYPQKKVIVYSAEDQGHVSAFHKAMNLADNRLSKNAQPYEFITIVERYAMQSFSLEQVTLRIKSAILKEYGKNIDTTDIMTKISKINDSNDFSLSKISKVFNLQNAGSIASIVSIFLKPA